MNGCSAEKFSGAGLSTRRLFFEIFRIFPNLLKSQVFSRLATLEAARIHLLITNNHVVVFSSSLINTLNTEKPLCLMTHQPQ